MHTKFIIFYFILQVNKYTGYLLGIQYSYSPYQSQGLRLWNTPQWGQCVLLARTLKLLKDWLIRKKNKEMWLTVNCVQAVFWKLHTSCFRPPASFLQIQTDIYLKSVKSVKTSKHFPIRQIQFHHRCPITGQNEKHILMLSLHTAVQMFTLAGVSIRFNFSQEDKVQMGTSTQQACLGREHEKYSSLCRKLKVCRLSCHLFKKHQMLQWRHPAGNTRKLYCVFQGWL